MSSPSIPTPLPATPAGPPRGLAIFTNVLAIVLVLALLELLLLTAGGTLTYDEANYFHLASSIRESGLPIWYWHPDRPEIFSASPPLVLYAMAWVQSIFGDGVVGVRFLYFLLFGVPGMVLTYWLSRRAAGTVAGAASIIVLILSGAWVQELLRVRFDMPLALISFVLLLLFIRALDAPETTPRWHAIAFALLSAMGLTVKYQFVTVTATLALATFGILVVSENPHRRRNALLYLGAHLLGVALAGTGLWMFYDRAYAAVADASGSLAGAVSDQVGSRLLPSGNLTREIGNFLRRLEVIAANISVPVLLYLCVKMFRSNIPTLERPTQPTAIAQAVLICFCAMVVAFNVATYRIDAATQYIVQLALPLAYLFGCTCGRLATAPLARGWRLATIAIAFAFHATLNVPDSSYFLAPNTIRATAAYLETRLDPTEIVLVGNARQSRDLPFWLKRTDNYGYLWTIPPQDGVALLSRQERPVGAVVLPIAYEPFTWRNPNWQPVRAALDANFSRVPEVGGGIYSVYVRGGDR